MSGKVEEIKQATIEFYEKQQKLMKLMMNLTDEEHKEFNPWWMSYSHKTFKNK